MNILNIFSDKPIDFGAKDLQVDFHSHLIPGIDDGAKTMEDSLAMIRGLYELGYSKIITTPHIYWEYYPNTEEIIQEGLQSLHEEVRKEGISIELEAAAEYFLDEHFESLLDKEELLSFGNKHILVEMSFFAVYPKLEEIIFKLRTKGYRPIIAHPERYGYWANDMSKFKKVLELGAELQVNLLSLTGQYGRSVYKTAKKMIESGMVSYLGSDMHHRDHLDRLQKLFENKKIMRILDRSWENPSLNAYE